MSARTADRDVLSHGEELISGLLTRQLVLLTQIRLLVGLLVAVMVAGAAIGVALAH